MIRFYFIFVRFLKAKTDYVTLHVKVFKVPEFTRFLSDMLFKIQFF